jgi:hypothetical protein
VAEDSGFGLDIVIAITSINATSGSTEAVLFGQGPLFSKGDEMRRILLLTVAVLCMASLAFGQAGSIDIFTDAGFTSCNLAEPAGPSLTPIYIVHTNTAGATASVWKLEATDGAENLTYTGETNAFPTTIGDVFGGISVAYGACLNNPQILMVTVNFFYSPGAAPACGIFRIVGNDVHSQTSDIEIVDCSSNRLILAEAGHARVNPDAGCTCNVPTHETTWGGIKALYN